MPDETLLRVYGSASFDGNINASNYKIDAKELSLTGGANIGTYDYDPGTQSMVVTTTNINGEVKMGGRQLVGDAYYRPNVGLLETLTLTR